MIRMHLVNTTDIDDDLLREIIRFTRPANISNFDISVKYSDSINAVAGSARRHRFDGFSKVSIRINRNVKFPYAQQAHGAYLEFTYLDENEMLVVIIAHELRHIWQQKHHNGMVYNSRGKYSERDADVYAMRKLREWRRKHGISYDETQNLVTKLIDL